MRAASTWRVRIWCGCTSIPRAWRDGKMTEEMRLLLALYAERARIRYETRRTPAPRPRTARSLRPAEAMGRIYRTLLDELHARGFPCLGASLRLSKPRRLAIAAGTFLGARVGGAA